MSAQIITALRKRADALEDEAGKTDFPDESSAHATAVLLRTLAREFRALADEAEGKT